MKGFNYTVTDEQIAEHRQRSVLEIMRWIEETNRLMAALQTPEERRRAFDIKGKPAIHFEEQLKEYFPELYGG